MKKYKLAALLLLAAAPAAHGQVGKNYDVQTLNFDLWCQEQANLPAARCDKRLPEDEKTFEAYRATIERYEVPYLEQKRSDAELSRTLLHNDPTDAPRDTGVAGQGARSNLPPVKPPP